MKKFLAMLLAVAMLGGALAACGGGETTSTPSGNTGTPAGNSETPTVETVDINVGYMPNYGGLWSLMTAKEKGFFEEEGLNVTMTQFEDGPTIIAAMENGSVNFGYIGQGAHKLCVQGNATIIALSHISNGDALIGGPGISTVEDLKGKVVAYSSGTSSEDILRNALAAHNMTMDDIQAMDMDAPSIVTAMMSGGVDACATWSPNSLTILEGMEGTTKLADNMTFSDTTVSLASWIATPKYLEENRDVTVRFVRALMKAMDYAADGNYEEVAQWCATQAALDYDTMYNQRGDADWLTGKEVVDGVADGTVKGYYELQQKNLLDGGSITEEDVCPVEDYVDFDLMTEAGNY
ncbi:MULTISPECIES: ABC transporter substrate-binding protein [unclassified Flavonifractor]|uniref:ABC transporter substrate-binding protein n=1 Tax=unclassified Flavonifractor TaxID=2629267 RepID=UPI000B3A1BF9|nr:MULTISPECIES: ABC transporter substrate-binding protein [unclassified Flavonifractor]OUN11537.1 taurine ABC transporter substrate-binding protein [Flavonifractor sp. An91]OUQ60838.1 taurine ABC transporter substrate-binding protein [Flavonifractor sp. An112]